ncbi:alpha/beta hydrolase [Streptomyces beihaiensis]|uniref:Alpha/beta hydrolase n=1 Tax=Streptomyces beihaiensis TaxID=2984495 RepID=A0ABT3TTF3_9ACTN|nr:alpha/beta fold hydrolase [Streptomyces beihaiensis]MCX3060318.1 alpha/beta hydrolase [Streptomyces beihaiensis]
MTVSPLRLGLYEPGPGTQASGVRREELTFRVPAGEDTWHIAAELLVPEGGADTVQVLLPGLTYDRRYWTVPGDYDYSAHMVRAGYAVLLLDRLGTGASSRPHGDDVNLDSHVEVVHHIVSQLRSGAVGGRAFSRVAVVGHSYGSGIALVEAARYQDVDALVITGMLHTTTSFYEKVDRVHDFFHPVGEDPLLAELGAPAEYLTQRPGRRAKMLEYAGGIDPDLSAHNERIKSTATWGEGNSLPETYRSEYSRAVSVPVLIVVGEHDALFSSADVGFAATSDSVRAFEKGYYAPGADLEAHVIAGCGHSLTIHRTAADCYALTRDWLDRTFPRSV